jgi:hypothetical protein
VATKKTNGQLATAPTDAKDERIADLEKQVSDLKSKLEGMEQLYAANEAAYFIGQKKGEGVVDAFKEMLYQSYLKEIHDRNDKGPMSMVVSFKQPFSEDGPPKADWRRTA